MPISCTAIIGAALLLLGSGCSSAGDTPEGSAASAGAANIAGAGGSSGLASGGSVGGSSGSDGSVSGGSGSGGSISGSSGSGGSSGASGSAGQAGSPNPAELQLPIEVLGNGAPDSPTIAGTSLTLKSEDIGRVQTLAVSCHRCGFYDAPEYEALSKRLTKVKASLRVVGDMTGQGASAVPWLDITDANVRVEPVAAAHGGINGALVSLGFQVTIDAMTRARLVAGSNRIEFRFNGTNGQSNGFRILDVGFQDAAGKQLNQQTKRWADISAEKKAGQAAAAADVSEGKRLWTARNTLVKSSIVSQKTRASCSDCHAADGRDLQYFNYSNNSIVQRSVFHGLSDKQGRQIVAYIRSSLYGGVPDVPAAAPWNPPYQPGRGLDSKPVAEWAAGAGLSAVAPDGATALKAFVGQATDASPIKVTQAEIDAVMNPSKVLNTREVAVEIQYPDWNAWLPPISPLDLWTPAAGQSTGMFESTDASAILPTLTKVEAWLSSNKNPNGVYGDWGHLTPAQRASVQQLLTSFGVSVVRLGGGSRGTRVSPDPSKPFGVEYAAKNLQAVLSKDTAALADLTICGPRGACTPFNTEAFIERANVGLYHWMAVKQWELAHSFGLEGPQTALRGAIDSAGKWVGYGLPRGWLFSYPSVFYVAPHFLYAGQQTTDGFRDTYFAWENRLVSLYRSHQWYQLEMTLEPNGTNASQPTGGAMDWGYQLGITHYLISDAIAAKVPAPIVAAHVVSYFESVAKWAQLGNTNISFNTQDPKYPTNLFHNTGRDSKANQLYHLAPSDIVANRLGADSDFKSMDSVVPGGEILFINGYIATFNADFGNTTRSQYRICDPNAKFPGDPVAEPISTRRFCIDAKRIPLPLNSKGEPTLAYPLTTVGLLQWGLVQATKLGAEPKRLKAYSDWIDKIWPAN